MGRPAAFRGVTPGDLDTKGTNVPPIKGMPPRRKNINNQTSKIYLCPKRNGLSSQPALLATTSTGTDRQTIMKHRKYHVLSRSTPHINANNGPNTQMRQSGFRGGREEAAEPSTPPAACSMSRVVAPFSILQLAMANHPPRHPPNNGYHYEMLQNCLNLDGPIRANRFADSRESPDSRESFQGP